MNKHDLRFAADRYLLANPCSAKHADNIRQRCAKYCRWRPGRCRPPEITAEDINRFLLDLEKQGLSPHTINGYRANLMAVLTFALGEKLSGKIRRVRPPWKEVSAWRVQEIRQLCAIARTYRGRLANGVPRRLFWLTAIHVGFSTGQRYSDIIAMEVAKIRKDRTLTLVQSKTGKRVTVRFSRVAMRLIQAHGQPMVLPNPHSQNWFCRKFSELIERAGVMRGSFKWLRRSAGSYVDRQNGRGPELLGNTRAVFDASYRSEQIVRRAPPEPPEL